MSLYYKTIDPFPIIGTKTTANARTGVTLTSRYQFLAASSSLRQAKFNVGGMSKLEMSCLYTAGTGETANSVELKVEGSPDGTNWYRFVNESVSGGTSTLAPREFTILQSTTDGTLNYTAQGANYTAGLVLTGGTSAATAVIESDADAGTTGTLVLSNIAGTFVNAETITDSSTGTATSSGVLTSRTGFTIPLDISCKQVRISAKESGVASNFGTLYVEATLNGL